MKGYDVRSIDGDKIGHVVDTDGDFLIVEHGLLKSKHALPMQFADIDPAEEVVRTTLAKDLIYHSPKVNGDVDEQAIAEHYGLAEGFSDPTTRGLSDDSEFAADERMQEHVAVRGAVTGGEGPLDEAPPSPGVTGGDRRRDFPKDYDKD